MTIEQAQEWHFTQNLLIVVESAGNHVTEERLKLNKIPGKTNNTLEIFYILFFNITFFLKEKVILVDLLKPILLQMPFCFRNIYISLIILSTCYWLKRFVRLKK